MTQVNTNARPPISTWVHPSEGRRPVSGHPNLRQVTNQPQSDAQFQDVGAPPNRVNHVSAIFTLLDFAC